MIEETRLSLLRRLFSRREGRDALVPLYRAVVTEGRAREWYADLGVPDTKDGRFDAILAVMAVAMLRLEAEGEAGSAPAAMLTELFIDDMDGQLREEGVGDVVVGKHVGRMMSALGGRISAYRAGLAGKGDLRDALARNLYRTASPSPETLAAAEARMRALFDAARRVPLDRLLEGNLR